MNHTPDTTADHGGNGNTAGDGGSFGPQQAADLLDQATQQARRKFQHSPPLLSLFRAVVVLGAFGAIWLSVRGQHPYKGPSGWAIAVAYILVGLVIGASTAALKRANAGVTGPAQRAKNAGIAVLLVAWVAVYVFQAALHVAGASNAIVYGLYPAVGPLLIVGLAGAANGAGRQDWAMTGSCLTAAVVALVAAFGGPVGAWLIMGVGLCAVFLGTAVFTAWAGHRSVVRA